MLDVNTPDSSIVSIPPKHAGLSKSKNPLLSKLSIYQFPFKYLSNLTIAFSPKLGCAA
jgi:hypothetical protein